VSEAILVMDDNKLNREMEAVFLPKRDLKFFGRLTVKQD